MSASYYLKPLCSIIAFLGDNSILQRDQTLPLSAKGVACETSQWYACDVQLKVVSFPEYVFHTSRKSSEKLSGHKTTLIVNLNYHTLVDVTPHSRLPSEASLSVSELHQKASSFPGSCLASNRKLGEGLECGNKKYSLYYHATCCPWINIQVGGHCWQAVLSSIYKVF